jgi:hypothetical protein
MSKTETSPETEVASAHIGGPRFDHRKLEHSCLFRISGCVFRIWPALALILALIAAADVDAAGRRRRWFALGSAPAPSSSPAARKSMPLVYPATKQIDHSDDYHGTKVADPYRWLEEPDSPATKAWIAAQNQLTFGWLETIPSRERLRQRLTTLWNYERYGQPHKKGGRYFYARNDGLQNQSAVFVAERLDGPPRLLFDPNTLSADGTIALKNWTVSEDGKLMAYGLAGAGSDWEEWGVLEVDSGRVLPDKIKWVKFSRVSWTHDPKTGAGTGFFYSRYDEPPPGQTYTGQNYYHKLFYHRLGQPQEQDALVYERPDQKEWGFDGEVTEDGRFLIISVWRSTEQKNLVFYRVSGPRGREFAGCRADPRVRGGVSLPRQRRDAILVHDGFGCLIAAVDRHRHDAPRAGELEGNHPAIARHAPRGKRHRRSLHRCVPEGCRLGRQGLRPRGQARPRRPTARTWIGRRFWRPPRRQRDVLLVHQLYRPRLDLSLRRQDRPDVRLP